MRPHRRRPAEHQAVEDFARRGRSRSGSVARMRNLAEACRVQEPCLDGDQTIAPAIKARNGTKQAMRIDDGARRKALVRACSTIRPAYMTEPVRIFQKQRRDRG